MWLFYPVQQISYVSLSYFTANHSFLPKAGLHPVSLQKLQMLTPLHNNANNADNYNRVTGIAQLEAEAYTLVISSYLSPLCRLHKVDSSIGI